MKNLMKSLRVFCIIFLFLSIVCLPGIISDVIAENKEAARLRVLTEASTRYVVRSQGLEWVTGGDFRVFYVKTRNSNWSPTQMSMEFTNLESGGLVVVTNPFVVEELPQLEENR